MQIVWKNQFKTNMILKDIFIEHHFLLGYAIIGHKSQGATISSKVMIHIREAFTRGLVYVLLFRVTSDFFLKIVNNLQPSDIQPMLPWFLKNVNTIIN